MTQRRITDGSSVLRPSVLIRLTVGCGAALTGIATALALSPGGLGDPEPRRVTTGWSAEVYRWAAGVVDGGPAWLRQFLEWSSEATLSLLVLLLAAAWWAGRRRGAAGVAGPVLVGVAASAAYLGSEALKLVVDQERPCRTIATGLADQCPTPGDWSFPSNHSTIAGALGVGLLLVRHRLALVALACAVATALLRVLSGMHYPHDVVAGLALGGGVTAAVVVSLMPLAVPVLHVAGRFPAFGLLVRHRQ